MLRSEDVETSTFSPKVRDTRRFHVPKMKVMQVSFVAGDYSIYIIVYVFLVCGLGDSQYLLLHIQKDGEGMNQLKIPKHFSRHGFCLNCSSYVLQHVLL